MWPMNALSERLNFKWPVLQAPMGSASTPTLAAAVISAGGLGGLGMWGRSAEPGLRDTRPAFGGKRKMRTPAASGGNVDISGFS